MKFKIRSLRNNYNPPHELAYEHNDIKWLIDINSIEELMKIGEDVNEDLIISTKYYDIPEIIIYDDYME